MLVLFVFSILHLKRNYEKKNPLSKQMAPLYSTAAFLNVIMLTMILNKSTL